MKRAEGHNLRETKPGDGGWRACVTLQKMEQAGLGGSGWL